MSTDQGGPGAASVQEPDSASAKSRVLLVDDDPATLQTHLRILAEYSPLRAEDGVAAQKILRNTDVDVVVCDLGMPRLSGLDLMQWAKDHRPRALWIVVSGQDTYEAAVHALKLGAFDFLGKPLGPVQLQNAVANAIRHQTLIGERASLVRGLAESNLKLTESLRKLEGAYEILRDQRTMLDQDLQRARGIMQALLPQTLPGIEEMHVNVGYRPCDAIGGDLYGVTILDDRHFAVFVADAAGHGVSAALLAALFSQGLRVFEPVGEPRTPIAMLAELNRVLLDECQASGLFVTAILAVVDQTTRTMTIASAGHPRALLLRSTGPAERVGTSGPALGLAGDATFEQHRISLAAGDRVLFYTDGVTDSCSEAGSSTDEMMGAIIADAKDGQEAIDNLFAWVGYKGTSDDVTLLLLTAEAGVSTVHAAEASALPAAPHECGLRIASTDRTTWIAIQGHAIWKHASTLRDACREALGDRRRTIVDLGTCTMLDSTMLGTLHEIVTRTERGSSLCIHNVCEEIRRLFEELAMMKVLRCVVAGSEPLPTVMRSLRVNGVAGAEPLVLHAHELLAELSMRNSEQFAPVIEALRAKAPAR